MAEQLRAARVAESACRPSRRRSRADQEAHGSALDVAATRLGRRTAELRRVSGPGHPVAPGPPGLAPPSTNGGSSRQANGHREGGIFSRLASTVRDQVEKRVPAADLHERDPDFLRDNLPGYGCWRASTSGPRCAGSSRIPAPGPGAAGRQPLGREHDPRHLHLHARVQHLLRCRAALLPAGPQPRAGHAAARAAAEGRHDRGLAGERGQGARHGRRRARLSGRRLRDAPAHRGSRRRSTSAGARASSGWPSRGTCLSSPWCRSAARRRRCS